MEKRSFNKRAYGDRKDSPTTTTRGRFARSESGNSRPDSSNRSSRPARSESGTRTSETQSRSSFGDRSRSSSRSFGGRPSFRSSSSSGSGRFTGSKNGRGRGRGQRIDVSRFINKAVITEQVDKFIPEHNFNDFKIDERLKANIAKKGYLAPTPIQDKAIPHVLRGADVVGIANTGTGKTAGFLLPLINKVLLDPKENILIMVPTRELAIQIDQELKEFSKGMKIFSVCCVGGAPIGRQINELRYKNNFIIGTPGRLKDLMNRKVLFIDEFNTVVLDEADRMLDMGFIADMRMILAQMPKNRHTLFFSATLSREIEGLISEFLKEPVTISVKTGDTSKNVDQDIVRIKQGDVKVDVLHDLLIQNDFKKVLVFGKTKHGVEKLTDTLQKRGFSVESIHGDKNHARRQKALSLFKGDKVQVLIATDVAARGLDISGVSHVINFDLPESYEDYVHRIGRTGRGDQKGKALTFVE